MSSTFDGVFFLSLGSLVCGGFALCCRSAYRMKCSEIECCCIKLTRNVEEEGRIDLEAAATREGQQAKRSSLSLGFNNKM